MTWGFLLVLLSVLDSRGQEGPIGLVRGHRLATDFSILVYKRGTQSFEVQVDNGGLRIRSILGLRYWKVRRVTLSTDRDLVVLSAI